MENLINRLMLQIDRHGYLNCAGLDNSILAAGSYKSCFILDLEHDFIQKIKNPTTSIAFLDSVKSLSSIKLICI